MLRINSNSGRRTLYIPLANPCADMRACVIKELLVISLYVRHLCSVPGWNGLQNLSEVVPCGALTQPLSLVRAQIDYDDA